jgi:hypothetical protein
MPARKMRRARTNCPAARPIVIAERSILRAARKTWLWTTVWEKNPRGVNAGGRNACHKTDWEAYLGMR